MRRRAHRPPALSVADAPLLPGVLRERLVTLLGEEVPALEDALGQPAPTSIRLNPFKPFALDAEQVPWCASGRYLIERPAFTLDPLLHAGAYYVQEASSMLIEQALISSDLLDRKVLALDLCAAPGGKSTHLLSLLKEGSLLVANEPDAARRHILAENIWKHGGGNTIITGSDPRDLAALPATFDLVLVDAPCSGEGMFRKDPFARQQWSPALVESCATRQRDIVKHAWNALAPGGTLIYSTCTWEDAENEEQLQPFVRDGAISMPVPLDHAWGIVQQEVEGVIGHRCYPHRVRGEGFFMTVLHKPGEPISRSAQSERTTSMEVPDWLRSDADMVVTEHREVLHALPAAWSSQIQAIASALRVHAPGTPFAERKGDTWIPYAAAAFSRMLDRSIFPELDLSATQAISYLSGEALPAVEASGIALVTYRGFGLGWVHGAGRRWNNRWPAPWRIRMQRSSAPRVSWHGS